MQFVGGLGVAKNEPASEMSREERNFAAQVKTERENRRWTQEELAKRMRLFELPYVNQATVSRIENMTRPVRLMEAQALSTIFERTVYAMTNPDQREFIFNVIRANDRDARRHYVAYKKELLETAIAQQAALEEVAELQRLYGDDEDLDPETESRVQNLLMNRANFAKIPLIKEATEIVRSAKLDRRATVQSEDGTTLTLSSDATGRILRHIDGLPKEGE